MTLEEYDEHLKGRSDYIKAIKKDSSNEKIVRKTGKKDAFVFLCLRNNNEQGRASINH